MADEQGKPHGHGIHHEDIGRQVLTGEARGLRSGRRVLKHLPSSPRCKLCGSPFGGAVAPLMRLVGMGPWPKNPKYCSACFKQLRDHRSGAEIECSLLFADVRGSTAMAEQIHPAEFRQRMDRFFTVASQALWDQDGIVDKFVGDEVIGIFIPALTGELHAQRAIAAGQALLKATGNDGDDAWAQIGVGVNTGVAYVGVVGAGDNVELSAMGDPVNVTARLASIAGAGELLVTLSAARAAQLPEEGLEHRRLELKGKSASTEVVVLHAL